MKPRGDKGREEERERYGKGCVSIFSLFLSILVFLMAPFLLAGPCWPHTYTHVHTWLSANIHLSFICFSQELFIKQVRFPLVGY